VPRPHGRVHEVQVRDRERRVPGFAACAPFPAPLSRLPAVWDAPGVLVALPVLTKRCHVDPAGEGQTRNLATADVARLPCRDSFRGASRPDIADAYVEDVSSSPRSCLRRMLLETMGARAYKCTAYALCATQLLVSFLGLYLWKRWCVEVDSRAPDKHAGDLNDVY